MTYLCRYTRQRCRHRRRAHTHTQATADTTIDMYEKFYEFEFAPTALRRTTFFFFFFRLLSIDVSISVMRQVKAIQSQGLCSCSFTKIRIDATQLYVCNRLMCEMVFFSIFLALLRLEAFQFHISTARVLNRQTKWWSGRTIWEIKFIEIVDMCRIGRWWGNWFYFWIARNVVFGRWSICRGECSTVCFASEWINEYEKKNNGRGNLTQNAFPANKFWVPVHPLATPWTDYNHNAHTWSVHSRISWLLYIPFSLPHSLCSQSYIYSNEISDERKRASCTIRLRNNFFSMDDIRLGSDEMCETEEKKTFKIH